MRRRALEQQVGGASKLLQRTKGDPWLLGRQIVRQAQPTAGRRLGGALRAQQQPEALH